MIVIKFRNARNIEWVVYSRGEQCITGKEYPNKGNQRKSNHTNSGWNWEINEQDLKEIAK